MAILRDDLDPDVVSDQISESFLELFSTQLGQQVLLQIREDSEILQLMDMRVVDPTRLAIKTGMGQLYLLIEDWITQGRQLRLKGKDDQRVDDGSTTGVG